MYRYTWHAQRSVSKSTVCFQLNFCISADTLSPSSKSLDATNASTLSTDVLAIEANNANANTQSSGAAQRALTARFSRYFYLPQPPPSHHHVGHIHTVAYSREHTQHTHTLYTHSTIPHTTCNDDVCMVFACLRFLFFCLCLAVQIHKSSRKHSGNFQSVSRQPMSSLPCVDEPKPLWDLVLHFSSNVNLKIHIRKKCPPSFCFLFNIIKDTVIGIIDMKLGKIRK